MIFFDTNIIQHYQNNLLGLKMLHFNNIDFYKIEKCLLLPQVIHELEDHGIDYKEGLGSIIKIQEIENHLGYIVDHIKKLRELVNKKKYIRKQSEKNLTKDFLDAHKLNFKYCVCDGLYYLNNRLISVGGNSLSHKILFGFCVEDIYKIEKEFGFDINVDKYGSNDGDCLGRLIENTEYGEYRWNGFTYKDLNRSIGNFMFDYKNFLEKGQKQKSKIGKDSIIVSQIVEYLGSNYSSTEKLYLISSDKDFIKEFQRYICDIKFKNLLETNILYKDLSKERNSTTKFISGFLIPIYLDINKLKFLRYDTMVSHSVLEEII